MTLTQTERDAIHRDSDYSYIDHFGYWDNQG